jgi:hypothetical protein
MTHELKLAQVPQILDLMEQKKLLTTEKSQQVKTALKDAPKGAFAGEIAVQKGFVTSEELQTVLIDQTVMKAEAAANDIAAIANTGEAGKAPAWLKANWGNNGVNKASENPSIADGVSAAANVAQNIVMLANAKPELAAELKPAVEAASNLAKGIAGKGPLNEEQAAEWSKMVQAGVKQAIEKSGVAPMDGKGQPIQLEDFIRERSKETDAAVEKRLEVNKQAQAAGFAAGLADGIEAAVKERAAPSKKGFGR